MQHKAATLAALIALTVLHHLHCAGSAVSAVDRLLSEPADWLSSQGDCSQFFTSRRFITQEEAALIATRTPNNASSSRQRPGWLEPAGDRGSSIASGAGSPWCPALLWTYTGTGNTMKRLLIEAASGWHTGSVYTGEQKEQNPAGHRVHAH